MYELDECFQKNIKIFGYVLGEDARPSFNECQKIYKKKGGEYEIIDFIITNNISSYYKTDYKFDDFCSGRGDYEFDGCYDLCEEICKKSFEKNKEMLKGKEEINKGFTKRVINTVKSVLKKK